MIASNQVEIRVVVAANKQLKIWGSVLRTSQETTRQAAKVPADRGDTSQNELIATAIVATLASVRRKQYNGLCSQARVFGADRPRLQIKAYRPFITKYKNGDLRLSPRVNRVLNKLLALYTVTWIEADDPQLDQEQKAVIEFARRMLCDDALPPRWMRAEAISTYEVPETLPAPVTPSYEERQHAR